MNELEKHWFWFPSYVETIWAKYTKEVTKTQIISIKKAVKQWLNGKSKNRKKNVKTVGTQVRATIWTR